MRLSKRCVARPAHPSLIVSAALATILSWPGLASAGFTVPEDQSITQTLTLSQLLAPGGGAFFFTEVANPNFTPALADITISDVLWSDQRVINMFETQGGLLAELIVFQNIGGAAHILYSGANDLGQVFNIPNIGSLPVSTVISETFVTLLPLQPRVGLPPSLPFDFMSDSDPNTTGISDRFFVPEPASVALMGIGVVGLFACARHRRLRSAA